jgi:transposase
MTEPTVKNREASGVTTMPQLTHKTTRRPTAGATAAEADGHWPSTRVPTRSANTVERCFNKVKHGRRRATRADKHLHNYEAGLHLASVLIRAA